MSKKIVIGNWKMNRGGDQGLQLLTSLISALPVDAGSNVTVVICPPYTLLREARKSLPRDLALGAQNAAAFLEGAYTGEISAEILKDAGCTYVILGHSERRKYMDEGDAVVLEKARLVVAVNMIPVLCVGESGDEREQGNAEAIVAAQVATVSSGLSQFVIAYEPLWAIGTGVTPTLGQIASMHQALKSVVGAGVSVLYGGSVTDKNADEIMTLEGVDGVLVGGASLKPDIFGKIIQSAWKG